MAKIKEILIFWGGNEKKRKNILWIYCLLIGTNMRWKERREGTEGKNKGQEIDQKKKKDILWMRVNSLCYLILNFKLNKYINCNFLNNN
jgi:hypothetical protein